MVIYGRDARTGPRSLRHLFTSGFRTQEANRLSGVYELILKRASEAGSPGSLQMSNKQPTCPIYKYIYLYILTQTIFILLSYNIIDNFLNFILKNLICQISIVYFMFKQCYHFNFFHSLSFSLSNLIFSLLLKLPSVLRFSRCFSLIWWHFHCFIYQYKAHFNYCKKLILSFNLLKSVFLHLKFQTNSKDG